MTDTTIDAIAERLLREAAESLTTPSPGECLQCYVARMLDAFGCDRTLRFARRFRDLRAPRATALEGRLAVVGGFCDCEIFLNGWWLGARDPEAAEAGDLPECAGVRAGSCRPCRHWVRLGRGEWP